VLFELSLSNLPRLGALRCAPCTSRPCWGKASFGARLAARFLLILRRGRLCCGFWLPPPSQKPQRPNQYVYKSGCPLLPLQYSKKPHGRGKQSLSRTVLEKRGQKGKFFRHQKFALLHSKPFQFTRFSRRRVILFSSQN